MVDMQMCWDVEILLQQFEADSFGSKVDGTISLGPHLLVGNKGEKGTPLMVFCKRIHWLSVSASQRFWLDPLISATSRAMPESVFEGTSLCKFFVTRPVFELLVGRAVLVHCTHSHFEAVWKVARTWQRQLRSKGGPFFFGWWFGTWIIFFSWECPHPN